MGNNVKDDNNWPSQLLAHASWPEPSMNLKSRIMAEIDELPPQMHAGVLISRPAPHRFIGTFAAIALMVLGFLAGAASHGGNVSAGNAAYDYNNPPIYTGAGVMMMNIFSS